MGELMRLCKVIEMGILISLDIPRAKTKEPAMLLLLSSGDIDAELKDEEGDEKVDKEVDEEVVGKGKGRATK